MSPCTSLFFIFGANSLFRNQDLFLTTGSLYWVLSSQNLHGVRKTLKRRSAGVKEEIKWVNTQVCHQTHPQLHTSMAGEYLSSPSRSSGGRYHSVITLLVYGRLGGEGETDIYHWTWWIIDQKLNCKRIRSPTADIKEENLLMTNIHITFPLNCKAGPNQSQLVWSGLCRKKMYFKKQTESSTSKYLFTVSCTVAGQLVALHAPFLPCFS